MGFGFLLSDVQDAALGERRNYDGLDLLHFLFVQPCASVAMQRLVQGDKRRIDDILDAVVRHQPINPISASRANRAHTAMPSQIPWITLVISRLWIVAMLWIAADAGSLTAFAARAVVVAEDRVSPHHLVIGARIARVCAFGHGAFTDSGSR
jgi:hypothetical protein